MLSRFVNVFGWDRVVDGFGGRVGGIYGVVWDNGEGIEERDEVASKENSVCLDVHLGYVTINVDIEINNSYTMGYFIASYTKN